MTKSMRAAADRMAHWIERIIADEFGSGAVRQSSVNGALNAQMSYHQAKGSVPKCFKKNKAALDKLRAKENSVFRT